MTTSSLRNMVSPPPMSEEECTPEKKPISPEKLPRAIELYQKHVLPQQLRNLQFEKKIQEIQEIPSQSTIRYKYDDELLSINSSSRSSAFRSSAASFANHSGSGASLLSELTTISSLDGNSEYEGNCQRFEFNPSYYERAKAHLIRHLGACPRCRAAKVQVSCS